MLIDCLSKLPKIIKNDKGTALIINNIAICYVKVEFNYPEGIYQFAPFLPINYRDLNYIALVNSDSKKAIGLFATPTERNRVSISQLNGEIDFKINLITIGEINS